MNKIEAFYQAVYPYLKHKSNILVDACCGDGKAGARFSRHFKKIIFLDIRQTRGLNRTTKKARFDLEINLNGVDSFAVPEDAAIIAIHACADLTDKLLEKALSSRTGIAIMPCCYNARMKKYSLQNPPDRRKLMYAHEKDYYDAFRIQYLRENGFNASIHQINQKITPMNNVIVAVPKSFSPTM